MGSRRRATCARVLSSAAPRPRRHPQRTHRHCRRQPPASLSSHASSITHTHTHTHSRRKHAFSENLFHRCLPTPIRTAFSDYTGPDLLCSMLFFSFLVIFLYFHFRSIGRLSWRNCLFSRHAVIFLCTIARSRTKITAISQVEGQRNRKVAY